MRIININDVSIQLADYKRYQMNDIGRIEKRLANVEYFTSLSRLENNVNSQFIPDANGLDRFKNGFFTDNFADRKGQDSATGIRNSIDRSPNISTSINSRLFCSITAHGYTPPIFR